MFDNVKLEKEKAIARFNRLREIAKLRQFLEILFVFALISWSSARVPAIAGDYLLDYLSSHLLNHHVVFLIGNAIIALLLVLCRRNGATATVSGGDFYDEYVKYSGAAAIPPPPVGENDEEVVPPCDDVAAVIEKAERRIKRFERAESEKLKREIAVAPRPELRRSETENCRREIVCSVGGCDVAEMETLSSEEFRRRVDAFIDRHWGKRTTKRYQFEERENYQLVKMS